jgi:predicted dehydrogenase
VYIGTLHPTHYEDVKGALNAGKHVLVEKPATLNAAEWKELVALATEKKLFLMEAFWTAFQPAVAALRTKLHEDKIIGDIHAVSTNFSVPNYNVLPDDHRIIGLAAAGGPLLDIGAYCMVPARVALTENPANKGAAPKITCAMSKTRMGTDLDTTIILDYPDIEARAVCNMSFNARMPREHTATISGTKGEVVIHDVLCRIQKFSVTLYTPGETPQKPGKWGEPQLFEYAFPGTGLYFEADAVARDIRDGRTENELASHKYTTETLQIFDEARRQGGYVLPEGMEKVGRVGAEEAKL